MAYKENKKEVYIIHGYGASPQNHWFAWLKEKLEAKGVQATIVHLPHSLSPKYDEWISALAEQISNPGEETYFVAHSLGSISLLKYLQQARIEGQVGGFLLVSAFDRSLPHLRELDEFTEEVPDYSRLIQTAAKRAVISARDDTIVPFSFSRELSHKLAADFYQVDKGGHFLAEDGFTSLPLADEILQKMIFQKDEDGLNV